MLVESILGEYAGAGSMELWVKGGLGLGKVRGGPKKEMYIYIYTYCFGPPWDQALYN